MPFTRQQDIYALGMVMYEILHPHLSYPWENMITNQAMQEFIQQKVQCGERPILQNEVIAGIMRREDGGNLTIVAHQYMHLMHDCWDQDPSKRPNITNIIDLVSHLNISYFGENIFKGFEQKGNSK